MAEREGSERAMGEMGETGEMTARRVKSSATGKMFLSTNQVSKLSVAWRIRQYSRSKVSLTK
jgi:hypothetical protein